MGGESVNCESRTLLYRRLRRRSLTLTLWLLWSRCGQAANFQRGDVDGNTKLEMADAIRTFGFLFLGSPTSVACMDAADTNDSGKVDLSDGVVTLQFLFMGGSPPAPPGHLECGPDPSDDSLTCETSAACPGTPSPPVAPTGLTATANGAQVELDWADNTEPDLAGYRVYRSTTAGIGHERIGGSILGTSRYTDTEVSNGTYYYYTVTALDDEGSESTLSREASAQVITPPENSLGGIGHILNRLTFGPTHAAIEEVKVLGIPSYVNLQMHPETINEASNTALSTREDAMFDLITPSIDTILLRQGAVLRFFKGTQAPPLGWSNSTFEDASWSQGVSGIGYGDRDDATILSDMQQANGNPGYVSVFVRQRFLADPSAVDSLILSISYDDGFVAYLNGTEVARRGLVGPPPPHSALATAHDAEGFEDIDITGRKNLLVNGTNVLAIQVHNNVITSGDLSLIPLVLSRKTLPGPQIRRIKSINHLQQLTHVRGVYSEKQLQTVLAEFWDNHFTTDYDKVAQYLDDLKTIDGKDAMSAAQAAVQAADLRHRDYQFYYDHALGNFEDLFIFQATSPSMLIYLDNVLNNAGVANENYSREIFELFAFGVDNRYNQKDIEQLAKCFTGWKICKVLREELPAYPQSATNPPAFCGVQYEDTVLLEKGAGWKYLKGTAEPTPDGSGNATSAWTSLVFDDAAWLMGSTGIGYGDGDDATVLSDMTNNYRAVYLRRKFTLTQAQIESPDPLLLAVDYDDGFVAYLNGVEVGRSDNLGTPNVPPPFTALANQEHEVTAGTLYLPLDSFRANLLVGMNVLAIQVHNSSLASSDLSMIPEIRLRKILGGIDSGDPNGVFTFYFDPSKHDTTQKVLFDGTPWKITIPAGRTGAAGLKDALDPVRAMVTHPSTKEFICIKLIQKFVSDEITIQTRDTAPLPLRGLLADCLAAWGPRGDIRAILNVILDPVARQSEFWASTNYRSKIRTPTEFVNASARVLGAAISGTGLSGVVQGMEWPVFTRDEPDGNEEDYSRATASLKDSLDYVQNLAENKVASYTWATLPYLDSKGLVTAEEIIEHFSLILFHGTLTAGEKSLLLEFLTTDENYAPRPLLRANTADFQARVEEFLGLMLSLPAWQFQ